MADFVAAQYAIDEIEGKIAESNGSGVPPANMAMITAVGRDGKVSLKFRPPAETVIDGQLICTPKKLMVRKKRGSAPASMEDGTQLLLLEGDAMHNYESTPYEDTGLTNGQEYFYRFFTMSDHDVWNLNAANIASAIPKEYTLLGFKIAKNESDPAARVTYTEGAVGFTPAGVNLSTGQFSYGSFSDMWFVKDNKPVMVNPDGTEAYELDPDDYTKKKDGTASEISDTTQSKNAMAKIPLVWLKMWEDSDYEYCNICDIQLTEDYHAYAHQRSDGTIMDFVYMSMFEGSLISSKVRSLKGQTPMNSQTGANELTYAKNNGTLWSTRSWSHYNLINMLLILMGKSTNIQEKFGYGHYSGGTAASSLLKTGTLHDKGQFYGTSGNIAMKCFHIENHYGDIWERIEGMTTNGSTHIMVKEAPPYNTSGSGYTDTGVVPGGTSGGYISAAKMTQRGLIPKTASGSDATYYCDVLWFAANCYARVGGSCSSGLLVGAFALSVATAVSHSGWDVGAALSCEQPNAA